MVIVIKTFFDTMLGVSMPEWFYNSFALLILMATVLSLIQLAFPKYSKYARITVLAITLGYLAYEILPVWGVATR